MSCNRSIDYSTHHSELEVNTQSLDMVFGIASPLTKFSQVRLSLEQCSQYCNRYRPIAWT